MNYWSDKLVITTIAIGMPKNLHARTFMSFRAFLPVKNNLLTSVHDDTDNYNRVIVYSTAERIQLC